MSWPVNVLAVIRQQCNQIRHRANELDREGRNETAGHVRAQAEHHEKALAAVEELIQKAKRAERKLRAYVGVCEGDKELTDTIIPELQAALTACGVKP